MVYEGADTHNREQDLLCSHHNGFVYGGESVSQIVTELVQTLLSYCRVQARISQGICESEEGPNRDMTSISIPSNKI